MHPRGESQASWQSAMRLSRPSTSGKPVWRKHVTFCFPSPCRLQGRLDAEGWISHKMPFWSLLLGTWMHAIKTSRALPTHPPTCFSIRPLYYSPTRSALNARKFVEWLVFCSLSLSLLSSSKAQPIHGHCDAQQAHSISHADKLTCTDRWSKSQDSAQLTNAVHAYGNLLWCAWSGDAGGHYTGLPRGLHRQAAVFLFLVVNICGVGSWHPTASR